MPVVLDKDILAWVLHYVAISAHRDHIAFAFLAMLGAIHQLSGGIHLCVHQLLGHQGALWDQGTHQASHHACYQDWQSSSGRSTSAKKRCRSRWWWDQWWWTCMGIRDWWGISRRSKINRPYRGPEREKKWVQDEKGTCSYSREHISINVMRIGQQLCSLEKKINGTWAWDLALFRVRL